jgi:hypothetical protein
MIRNRIVTRGFSKTTRNLIVTRGFIPSLVQQAQEAVIHFLKKGRSALYDRRKDECDEFTIRASLVRVNKTDLVHPISNKIKVVICPNSSLFVRARDSVRTAIIETVRTILIRAGISRWKR